MSLIGARTSRLGCLDGAALLVLRSFGEPTSRFDDGEARFLESTLPTLRVGSSLVEQGPPGVLIFDRAGLLQFQIFQSTIGQP